MDIIRQIAEWSNGFLEKSMFVVDIEQKPGSNKICVYIDGDDGIKIDSCRLLARHLSEMLDEMDYGENAYYLEVSSPGAERPLAMPRQYTKHVGRELLVKMHAQTELLGRLKSIEEDAILIELKDKKKAYKDAKEKRIPFEEIASTMVQLSFK